MPSNKMNDIETVAEIMSLDEFLEFAEVLSLERRKIVMTAMLNQYLLIHQSQFFPLDVNGMEGE